MVFLKRNKEVCETDMESDGIHHDNHTSLNQSMNQSYRESISTEATLKQVRSGSRLVYIVLITTTIALSAATYLFLDSSYEREFESEFYSYARETADLAENNARNTFKQLKTLATTITSAATDSYHDDDEGRGWPNVTIPHWDERVTEIAKYAGAEMVMFVPFVQNIDKEKWEEYVNKRLFSDHVHHISHHPEFHDHHRKRSLEASGSHNHHNHGHNHDPIIDEDGNRRIFPCLHTTDDTRHGFVDEDEFMEDILLEYGYNPDNLATPVYQYSPMTSNKDFVMMDMFTHPVFKKEIVASIEYNVPVISEYLDLDWMLQVEGSNHTHYHSEQNDMHHEEDFHSMTIDAVKESFDEDAKTVGFVLGVVPWNTFFGNILRDNDRGKEGTVDGIVVKVVSDCGSTFTYVINSSKRDRAKSGDWTEVYEEFQHLNYTSRFFWKDHHKGRSRHCHFDLVIYPSSDFYASYKSSNPTLYAGAVLGIFVFTILLFACYDRFVNGKQQKIVARATQLVVDNATQAARNERELNDFVAHEVRNPLAAAMSACSFVSSAILEDHNIQSSQAKNDIESKPLIDSDDRRKSVQEDIEIIESSLHFINDLLRNMLDMQRAGSNQMKIDIKPTNIMDDVLRPVQNMLHVRGTAFEVILECPLGGELMIMTDPLRLKQVMLNLARNSAKFVEKGFVRCAARMNPVTGRIELSVEDSGPGIPAEKRELLFGKFQESLDSLHQGTGIGLHLCRKLTQLMGGRLYIDEEYDSGIEGCRGCRFVVELNALPLQSLDDKMLEFGLESSRREKRHYHNDSFTSLESLEEGITQRSREGRNASPKNVDPKSTISQDAPDSDGTMSISDLEEARCPVDVVENGKDAVGNGSPQSSKLDSTAQDGPQQHTKQSPPLQPPPRVATETQVRIAAESRELPDNLSVLFVDDDMVLRKMFSRSLKRVNPTWTIKEASNGETAIDIISSKFQQSPTTDNDDSNGQRMFDLIFMDQYMASVQKQLLGTETVYKIRAMGVTEPIICGLSANDVEKPFSEAGSDAFMFKPFPCKPDALKAELIRILDTRQR